MSKVSDEEAIIKRREMFERGQYSLSNDEGFFCEECEWRGLYAPQSDNSVYRVVNEDKSLVECPKCASDVYMKESEVDHLEKFKEDFYVQT